jgi:hypothetical protein
VQIVVCVSTDLLDPLPLFRHEFLRATVISIIKLVVARQKENSLKTLGLEV